MNYVEFFQSKIDDLKQEERYRVFANLARNVGCFPRATCQDRNSGLTRQVDVWCSNDYLGMGQSDLILGAIESALREARKAGAKVPDAVIAKYRGSGWEHKP